MPGGNNNTQNDGGSGPFDLACFGGVRGVLSSSRQNSPRSYTRVVERITEYPDGTMPEVLPAPSFPSIASPARIGHALSPPQTPSAAPHLHALVPQISEKDAAQIDKQLAGVMGMGGAGNGKSTANDQTAQGAGDITLSGVGTHVVEHGGNDVNWGNHVLDHGVININIENNNGGDDDDKKDDKDTTKKPAAKPPEPPKPPLITTDGVSLEDKQLVEFIQAEIYDLVHRGGSHEALRKAVALRKAKIVARHKHNKDEEVEKELEKVENTGEDGDGMNDVQRALEEDKKFHERKKFIQDDDDKETPLEEFEAEMEHKCTSLKCCWKCFPSLARSTPWKMLTCGCGSAPKFTPKSCFSTMFRSKTNFSSPKFQKFCFRSQPDIIIAVPMRFSRAIYNLLIRANAWALELSKVKTKHDFDLSLHKVQMYLRASMQSQCAMAAGRLLRNARAEWRTPGFFLRCVIVTINVWVYMSSFNAHLILYDASHGTGWKILMISFLVVQLLTFMILIMDIIQVGQVSITTARLVEEFADDPYLLWLQVPGIFKVDYLQVKGRKIFGGGKKFIAWTTMVNIATMVLSEIIYRVALVSSATDEVREKFDEHCFRPIHHEMQNFVFNNNRMDFLLCRNRLKIVRRILRRPGQRNLKRM